MALDLDRAQKTILSRAPLLPRGVVAAVGVGLAFGLGIVAGGGLGTARGEANTPTADVLARAEERTRSLDEKRGIKLTYASELQKNDALPVERASEQQKGTKVAAHAPAADDGAAAPLEPPPAPMPELKIEPVKAGSTEDDDDAAPEGPPAPAAEKADAARLQVALAKVLGDAPAVVDVRPVSKTFALQVASSPTRAGAEELQKKLIAAGHKARVVEGDVGGKAVFRVRVGSFADRAGADAYKGRLSTPAFVVGE